MAQNQASRVWNSILKTMHVAPILIHRLPCPFYKHNSDVVYLRTHVVLSCILPPPEHHGEMCFTHLIASNSIL
jgi:hypothetical protein